MKPLPGSWAKVLAAEVEQPYFRELMRFVDEERASKIVYPPPDDVLAALELTPFEAVRVVLIGQDPYHDEGQAHGLCFSVKPPTKPPPSLKNIFKELADDLGVDPPGHGDLTAWAKRGVLLLNAILTVVAHEPSSHKDKGWERFTDAIIRAVDAKDEPVVFCLWGNYAKKKKALVDPSKHVVIEGAHPSPLSMKRFFGSRPFSSINAALTAKGRAPVDWRIP